MKGAVVLFASALAITTLTADAPKSSSALGPKKPVQTTLWSRLKDLGFKLDKARIKSIAGQLMIGEDGKPHGEEWQPDSLLDLYGFKELEGKGFQVIDMIGYDLASSQGQEDSKVQIAHHYFDYALQDDNFIVNQIRQQSILKRGLFYLREVSDLSRKISTDLSAKLKAANGGTQIQASLQAALEDSVHKHLESVFRSYIYWVEINPPFAKQFESRYHEGTGTRDGKKYRLLGVAGYVLEIKESHTGLDTQHELALAITSTLKAQAPKLDAAFGDFQSDFTLKWSKKVNNSFQQSIDLTDPTPHFEPLWWLVRSE